VIATHNPGKLAEMRELLAPHGVEAVSAGTLTTPCTSVCRRSPGSTVIPPMDTDVAVSTVSTNPPPTSAPAANVWKPARSISTRSRTGPLVIPATQPTATLMFAASSPQMQTGPRWSPTF
jgi:hypothetical protein